VVIIDSDVLLLAFAFQNDNRQTVNQTFLETIQTARPATTVYNVMEVLGQLSFNSTFAMQWLNSSKRNSQEPHLGLK
jgi:lipid-A-disaccharide synthase-like uncharacterized protein